RARQLPHHRVDQRHRREFSAGEHEIPERKLFVDPSPQQPLVDTFVAAAEQRYRFPRGEFNYRRVIQLAALRGQVQHWSAACPAPSSGPLSPGPPQHPAAWPAAVGGVIAAGVRIGREITRFPCLEPPQPALQRARRDSTRGQRGKHLRKQRHDVETDHQSTPQSTSIRPASRSTRFTTALTQGSSCARFAPCSSITSCAPLENIPLTTPSTRPCVFTTSRPTRSAQ